MLLVSEILSFLCFQLQIHTDAETQYGCILNNIYSVQDTAKEITNLRTAWSELLFVNSIIFLLAPIHANMIRA